MRGVRRPIGVRYIEAAAMRHQEYQSHPSHSAARMRHRRAEGEMAAYGHWLVWRRNVRVAKKICRLSHNGGDP